MDEKDDGLNAARGMLYAVPLGLAAWSVIALFGVWYAYPEAVASAFDSVLRTALGSV
jgi:hypothetical protein